jgi:hypothetical protein
MQNPIKQLQNLLEVKRTSVAKLFTAYTIQTELEYDLALIRLEFRYDDETDLTLYEANLFVISNLLREADADVVLITQQIEDCSFKISQL